jgi:hypothetical protein
MRCTAALLSRIYVFAAFDGRWPGPYSARYMALYALRTVRAFDKPAQQSSLRRRDHFLARRKRCQIMLWNRVDKLNQHVLLRCPFLRTAGSLLG